MVLNHEFCDDMLWYNYGYMHTHDDNYDDIFMAIVIYGWYGDLWIEVDMIYGYINKHF